MSSHDHKEKGKVLLAGRHRALSKSQENKPQKKQGEKKPKNPNAGAKKG